MRIYKKTVVLFVIVFMEGIPFFASARTLTASLELRGFVPLFCQANVLSVTPLETGVALNVNHHCNARHQAVVSFSQPEAFAKAMLKYGHVTRLLVGDPEVRLPEENLIQGQRVLTITGISPTAETPIVTISLMTL